jgi:hypothetical protein
MAVPCRVAVLRVTCVEWAASVAPYLLTSIIVPAGSFPAPERKRLIMIRFDARTFARSSSTIFAYAVMTCGAGCAGRVYAGPANVEGPQVVAAPVQDDGAVVYVQDPPVVDIEAYPSVLYGGVSVYYVDGRWYQRGPRGWAYYRQEPAELGRQREEHWGRDHDPRWGDQRGRGAEQRGQDDRRAAPAERPGVTEAQPSDHRVSPPTTAHPRREEARPPPAPKRAPRVKVTPAPAPTPHSERR